MKHKTQLIAALDVHTLDEAKKFVDILYPAVKFFKVGSQLFTTCGQKAVEVIGKKGAKVFLDLKFHDIPHTVLLAASSGTGSTCEIVSAMKIGVTESVKDNKDNIAYPVFMMTVHIQGGKKMLEAAVKGAKDKAGELKIKPPLIIGVTVLTSEDKQADTEQAVLDRARIAKDAGLDGVVCSVHEAGKIREKMGEDFLIVTPGIRPSGYSGDDQARVGTVKQAIEAEVDFIVVGRPILKADNPLKAAEQILKDL
jgi:orotidine-5'-phosphate decarboxylase